LPFFLHLQLEVAKLGFASALIALRFHSKQSLRRKKKQTSLFCYALGLH